MSALKAVQHLSFAIADKIVRPGSVERLEIPIARLPPGSMSAMPVVVVHGAHPGPTVWVNAAIHGDELNGIAIIRRLLGAIDAKDLSGTVIAVPIVNVFGLVQESRYLPDRRDLNRAFPGSPRGSLAARLAHLFFETVVRRCSLGIDFHTGSNGRCNLPQIRCNLDDPTTRRFAEAFGSPLLLHSNLRDGSLRAAGSELGIPVLLFEAGEAMRFDVASVQAGVDGSLRVLHELGMVSASPPQSEHPITARKSKWIRASRSGFCHLSVGLGERVEKGRIVAVIADTLGKSSVAIKARQAGIVIGRLNTALVHQGDALVHLAQLDGA